MIRARTLIIPTFAAGLTSKGVILPYLHCASYLDRSLRASFPELNHVRVGGVLKLIGRPLLHDAPLEEECNAIGDGVGRVQVVSYDQGRGARLFLKIADHLVDDAGD